MVYMHNEYCSNFLLPIHNAHTHTHTHTVTGTFLNTLKFTVKDCDPNTGEPDDDVGFDDEYVVSERYSE